MKKRCEKFHSPKLLGSDMVLHKLNVVTFNNCSSPQTVSNLKITV